MSQKKSLKDQDIKPWGKLVTTNEEKVNSTELRDSLISIGRTNGNTIQVSDSRVSNKHCQLIYENGCCYLKDVSTNGTFFGKTQKIGKNNQQQLQSGDTFYILLEGKTTKKQDTIGFVFIQLEIPQRVKIQDLQSKEPTKKLITGYQEENNSQIHKIEPKIDQTQVYKIQQKDQQRKTETPDYDKYEDEFTCPICHMIFYQPVCVIPCLHSFCGSCLSLCIKKSRECPICRKVIISAKKNIQMCNLLEIFLQVNPEKDRTPKDKIDLNAKNIIQEEMSFDTNPIGICLRGNPNFDRNLFFNSNENYYNRNIFNLFGQQPGRNLGNIERLHQANWFQRQPQSNPLQFDESHRQEISNPFLRQIVRVESNSNEYLSVVQDDQSWPQQRSQNDENEIDDKSANQNDDKLNCLQCRDQICSEGQAHGTCFGCRRQMPNLELSYTQNEIQKHKCQFCQKLFCNLLNGVNCSGQTHRILAFKDHNIPERLNFSWFRNFHQEFEKLKKHFHTSRKIRSFTELLVHMINTYVKINMFSIVSNKEIYRNPQKVFEFPLTLETPFCDQCFQEVCFQFLLRYSIIYRDDIGNGPILDCWNGINCTNYSEEHGRYYNHLCEQTRFA